MSVEYFYDLEQGTPEWYAVRRGIPTASEFHSILAKGEGKTRRSYLMRLVGERLTGDPMWSHSDRNTERGKEMEAEARELYGFLRDATPRRVGFIERTEILSLTRRTFHYAVGASPDSVIGDVGLLEIKTKRADLQCEALLDGVLPPEHTAQVQGQLWVSDRRWVDFMSYWPKLQPLIVRVHRDETYIGKLAAAVAQFCIDLDDVESRLRTGSAFPLHVHQSVRPE